MLKHPLAAALGLALLLPAIAPASEELRDKLADLAKKILDNTKGDAVTVGQFSPTGLPDSNAGVGIEQLLAAALAGKASPDAKFEVKGDYGLVKSAADAALKVVKVKARLIEKDTGDDLVNLSADITIDGTRTIAQLLQITAAITPPVDPKNPPAGATGDPQVENKKQRNREVEQAAKEPKAVVHGTRVQSAEGSPYAVELLVKAAAGDKAKPRAATLAGGKAFVAVEKGELYEVRVHNASGTQVAVAVSIDGIDQFHFSENRNDKGLPKFTHYILDPHQDSTIQGWHRTIDPKRKDNLMSFLVTGYGEGAVSKAGLASRGAVGVIHVQFAKCKPLKEGARSAPGNETGFGPPVEVKQTAVRMEIEPPHEFVSIRYSR